MLNWFEFTLRLNGYPISEAKKHLREIQQIPESDYEAYIHKQRQKIVNYHLKNNNFYRSFVSNKSVENWENITVMQKKDLQIPLKERLSKNFFLLNGA